MRFYARAACAAKQAGNLPAPSPSSGQSWQAGFEEMLPRIERMARFAMRHAPNMRQACDDIVAQACLDYAHLYLKGRQQFATPTTLVRYATRHYHCGRAGGSRCGQADALSRGRNGDRRPEGLSSVSATDWLDPYSDPAELVAVKLDWQAFRDTMTAGQRRIVDLLTAGESTADVASACGVPTSYVCQVRTKMLARWQAFCA